MNTRPLTKKAAEDIIAAVRSNVPEFWPAKVKAVCRSCGSDTVHVKWDGAYSTGEFGGITDIIYRYGCTECSGFTNVGIRYAEKFAHSPVEVDDPNN